MSKIKVGIIGATGYTGRETILYMLRHNGAELKHLIALDYLDQPISDAFPILTGLTDLKCQEMDLDLVKKDCDAVFLCLPHTVAVDVVSQLAPSGIRIIDFSADFRFDSVDIYNKVYNMKHKRPELLDRAVYGIPELYRSKIKDCDLLANPGCYPTSAILPLYPLLENKLIEPKGIIIDSKSGASGAGRKALASLSFAEVNENFKAYSPGVHRHQPEIEEQLSKVIGDSVEVNFVPHLIPLNRGMLSTIYTTLRDGADEAKLRNALESKYSDELFVQVLARGNLPQTSSVMGTNMCQIGLSMTPRGPVIASVIDNLGKGASGQAVQNFNVMFGFDEREGLI
jgi:N-acetyl-gamma-glutamyl-phosphate reductase